MMQLTEVTTPGLAKDFIQVNVLLNQDNPNYVRPLDKDINQVFDSQKNKAFRHGEVTRWILKNEKGELIGRIAAFVNKKYKTKGDDVPVGGVGFFDCINNQAAADMLFDVAKHWLLQRGMGAMDGPINFGERDRWWGLLVEGFAPPVYCLNYNPAYYQQLFENYGFRPFFNQYCYGMNASLKLQDKFYKRHAACAADPHYLAMHLRKNQLKKFVRDFTIIYNKAWAGHGGMKQLSEAVVLKMFKSMKPVLDERINWFVYYKDEPIAMWINIPDLNQWFKYLNGKFDLWHKLKFLWIKRTKHCNKFTGIAFGIVPEFQAKGVDAYMIVEGAKLIQNGPIYDEYEMQWIGDFNPKMMNVAESLPTHKTRRLITYRYLFDRTKEFKPHPTLVF
ncbi:MAG TPA: hypothetical protein VFS36_13360 [Chitinophagaceae bacterium]|jgi:hypothetical protein|nr:hypothetical protein [Chitinophagaceae bacterium]